MNPNWPRWIFASASKIFKERCDPIPFFLEGDDRKTENIPQYIEFRQDGPYLNEITRGTYHAIIEINILIVCLKNDRSIHDPYRLAGIVASSFKELPIYRYGDGPDDDGSLVTCFKLVRSNNQTEAVRITQFGQIDPARPILQASVEGHYQEYLIG